MKNQPVNSNNQPYAAEVRAVSPFVRFLEASFFTEIFRREATPQETAAASEAGISGVPAEPPKVRRAAAGAQQ